MHACHAKGEERDFSTAQPSAASLEMTGGALRFARNDRRDVCTFVTRRLQKPRGTRVRITANTLAMEGTFIMKARRIIVTTLVTLALGCCVVGLGACASGGTPSNGANGEGGAPLTVAAMKGPTAIGMAHLMQEQDALADDGKKPAYEFTVAATADRKSVV